MAGKPAVLKIDILTDASDTQKDLAKTGDTAKAAAGDFDVLGQAIFNAMSHGGAQVSDSAEAMGKFGAAAGDTSSGINAIGAALAATGVADFTAQIAVATAVLDGLEGATRIYTVATQAFALWQKITAEGTKLWAAQQWLLNAAMSANPIGLIVIAVIALVAIIVVLWLKCAAFRKAVVAIWEAIKVAAVAVWDALKSAAMSVFNFLLPFIRAAVGVIMAIWTTMKSVVVAVFDFLKPFIRAAILVIVIYITIVYTIWKFIFGLIWSLAKFVFEQVAGVVKWFYSNVIKPIFAAVLAFVLPIWTVIKNAAVAAFNFIAAIVRVWWGWLSAIFRAVASAGTAVWTVIRNAAVAVFNAISAAFHWVAGIASSVWNAIRNAATSAFDAIWGVVQRAKDRIVDIFQRVTQPVVEVFNSIKGKIGDVINSIVDALRGPINTITGWFDNIKEAIQKVVEWIEKIKIPDSVNKILGKIGFGSRSIPAPSSFAAPGVFGLAAGPLAAGPAAATAGIALSPVFVVNVSIGGEQLNAHIDTRISAGNASLARRIGARAQVLR